MIPEEFNNLLLYKEVENKMGKYWFLEKIIWAEIKEGIHLRLDDSIDLIREAQKYYAKSGVVYISNRVNKYSTEIIDYSRMEELPYLYAFILISHSDHTTQNAKIERKFFNKPFKIFKSENVAAQWAIEQIKKPPFK